QLEQQFPVRAEVDALKSLDRMLGRLDGAKKEPHRAEFNRAAEVNLVVQLREGLEIRKEAREWNLGGPVDDETHRGVPGVVHHEHHRVGEIGIRQMASSFEEDCG